MQKGTDMQHSTGYAVHISAIKIPPDRMRREFSEEAIEGLVSSIEEIGLLHSPVLRMDDQDELWLVAGERRLRAIARIYEKDGRFQHNGVTYSDGMVPFTDFNSMDEQDALRAEFEENAVRVNLSWQETIAARAKLHNLRVEEAKEEGKQRTFQQTSNEIFANPTLGTQVREAVILEHHLQDPEIASAKTQKEALKVLKRKLEKEHRQRLASEFNAAETPHVLRRGPARELIGELPAGAFNCIITDPPYGIGAHSFGEQSGTGHSYADSKTYFKEHVQPVLDDLYRVAASEAHLYLFCDIRSFADLSASLLLDGWYVWQTPLIWNKSPTGMLPRPELGPRRCYETILYAIKGDMPVQKQGMPDVLTVSADTKLQHAAQKPVNLYVQLLQRSVLPGQQVFDPFCGRGTVFMAANLLKLVATGFELEEDAYNMAKLNLEGKGDAIDEELANFYADNEDEALDALEDLTFD